MAEAVQDLERRRAGDEDDYVVILDHRQMLGMLTGLLIGLGLMFAVGYAAGRMWPAVESLFGETAPVVQPAPQPAAPADSGPVTA